MNGGFQVVAGELAVTADIFSRQGEQFKAIMPSDGLPCPDGGDAAVNEAMRAVVELAGLLHLQFAGELDSHAAKLRQADDSYEAAEQDTLRSIHGVMAQ